MKGPQRDLDISVASAELWEYLYINDGNPHITTPVAVNTVGAHNVLVSVSHTSSCCCIAGATGGGP